MKEFPLPKSTLLRKTRQYNKVYRQGKRLRGNNFTLIYAPNDQTGNRCGISVHGRLKGSTKRNRIKRIIKEFYRLNQRFIPPPNDIVFAVTPGFNLKNPAEVKQAVSFLLKKVK